MSAETDWSAVSDAAHRDWVDSERNEKLEELEAEVIRLRAEVERLRDFLPEASICVQYAIDYGAPSRQSDRRDLLGKIDAAMGEGK